MKHTTAKRTCWSILLTLFTLFLPGQDQPSFKDTGWILSAPYAPVFQVLDTESSLGPYATKSKTITLQDLVNFHGHPCDGLILAATALHTGLRRLYPEGIVDRTDTGIVTNNSPCFGDAGAYLTGGRIRFGTQKIDPAMGNAFIIHRFSTGQTIRVSLKREVFPTELSELETTIKQGDANLEQVRQCQRLQLKWIRTLTGTSPEQLFDIEALSGFQWHPDSYEHRGVRGDVRMKEITGTPECLRPSPHKEDGPLPAGRK